MIYRNPWCPAALCILFGFVMGACGYKPTAKVKPLKKAAAAALVRGERQALNSVSHVLRDLAASAPDPAAPSSARAAGILSKLRSVPAAALPASLRSPWQEMIAILEAAAQSTTSGIPDLLRQRGGAAAQTLNAAMAAEGLNEFRF